MKKAVAKFGRSQARSVTQSESYEACLLQIWLQAYGPIIRFSSVTCTYNYDGYIL